MKLRGLLHRKLIARPKKQEDPELRRIYNEAYKKELEKRILANIERQESASRAKIEARARRDALRATTSRSERITAAGARLSGFMKEKIKNMPDADEYARRMEKISSAVTGKPVKKRTVTRG